MKKTSSFHLEQSTLDYILIYQLENNLSSRNKALEQMIFELRTLKENTFNYDNMMYDIEGLFKKYAIEKSVTVENNVITESKITEKGKKLKGIYSTMLEDDE